MNITKDRAVLEVLNTTNVFFDMFDVVRFVDAEDSCILQVEDGQVRKTSLPCFEMLRIPEPCENCSSLRALHTGEQVVKLEYVDGRVLLVMSTPVELERGRVVIEMGKDITHSMTVHTRNCQQKDDIYQMIVTLNHVAVTDALTGLYNRRFIDDKLPLALQNCELTGAPLSLAMVDIDHFKRFNDLFGHQAGDQVLKDLAEVMRSHMRRNMDFAARYGGEEFLLCFPGMKREECLRLCARICKEVGKINVGEGTGGLTLTISMGIAESTEVKSGQELIALADSRLYRAKSGGRNRVIAS